MSAAEIARGCGYSRANIERIEKEALRKLRRKLGAKSAHKELRGRGRPVKLGAPMMIMKTKKEIRASGHQRSTIPDWWTRAVEKSREEGLITGKEATALGAPSAEVLAAAKSAERNFLTTRKETR